MKRNNENDDQDSVEDEDANSDDSGYSMQKSYFDHAIEKYQAFNDKYSNSDLRSQISQNVFKRYADTRQNSNECKKKDQIALYDGHAIKNKKEDRGSFGPSHAQ